MSTEYHARAFLRRVDALPGEPPAADSDYFHMAGPVPKPPGSISELSVEDFEYVLEGSVYAMVDGQDQIADEPFYPILMSEDGYPDIFGYKENRIVESLKGLPETEFDED